MGTTTGETRRLRVTVTPTRGWLHPLDRALRSASGVGLEAFHGVRQLSDDTVITLAEVTGPLAAVEAVCDDTGEVVSHTVTPLGDGWLVFAWVEPTPVVERMLALRRDVEMVAEPPFEWTESGGLRLDVVAPAGQVRAAADRLREDVDVSVTRVGSATGDRLPTTHRGIVEEAIDVGYYDEPRTASLDDVAAAAETSRPAAERRLREAESRLFASVVGDR